MHVSVMAGSVDPSVGELLACPCLNTRQLARRITRIYDRRLEAANLTSGQFGVLAHMSRRPHLSISRLADVLGMDSTTLNRVLAPLSARGLLVVTQGKDDRRRRDVSLTDAGRATFRTAVPHWRAATKDLEAATSRQLVEALTSSLRSAVLAFD